MQHWQLSWACLVESFFNVVVASAVVVGIWIP